MSADQPAQNPEPIGTLGRTGSAWTHEEREKLLQRREQAVKLRSMGMTIAEVARRTGVGWSTANDDINRHLRALARMSTSLEHRQQIAEIYFRSILTCEKIMSDIADRHDLEAQELRLKTIDRIQKAGESLMKLYGMIGPNPIVLPTLPLTRNGIAFDGVPRSEIDYDKVRELREKWMTFRRQYEKPEPEPIEAEFEANGAPHETNGANGTETPPPPVEPQ